MKTFLLLSLAFAGVFGQSCDNSFKSFLECLAADTGDATKGKVLEEEFVSAFQKQVRECFDESIGSSNTKCVLSDSNLQANCWGNDGPLRGCDKCIEMAQDIRNKIFNANNDIRKCVRDEFGRAIVNDLQPCIRTELGDQTFTVPALPDFDLHADAFIKTIEDGMCERVQAYSRILECKDRNAGRAAKTSACMDKKKGRYPKHCALIDKCKTSTVVSSCSSKFDKTNVAVCKCMNTKREELHQTLDKIKDAVFNPQKSASVCETGVNNALGHWVADFEKIFKKCVPSSSSGGVIPNLPLSQLIHAGCVKAVDLDDDGKSKLVIGFRMVRNVMDALADRIDRFCDIC